MPQNNEFAERLSAEGRTADNEQNIRLNFAKDPIYAHLATLSTAAAIAGFSWDIRKKKGSPLLVATQHRKDKRDRGGQSRWLSIGGNIETNEAGVEVKSSLSFDTSSRTERVLPKAIEETLFKSGWPREIDASKITLERRSDTHGVPVKKVGVTATHAAFRASDLSIEFVKQTNDPEGFEDLFSILKETGAPFEEDATSGELALAAPPTTEISTKPEKHFAFHEALGVPESTISRARMSYEAFVEHMDLPYKMSPSD